MSGTGSLYRRGGVWWISYYWRGKRYREASRSTRKGDAQALLRKRTGEMGRGRLIGPDAERMTLDQMAEMLENDYRINGKKSLDRAQLAIQHLRAFFGPDGRAVDITTDRVTAYIASRQEKG